MIDLNIEQNYICNFFNFKELNNINIFSNKSPHPDSLIIVGVDEAGRGPLAGPVVAGAVAVDYNNLINGVKDSKKLSAPRRDFLYEQITNSYIFATGIISADVIDEINILQATQAACVLAINNLKIKIDLVLIDGNMKFINSNFISIIKGDDLCYSIAAASIVAKVTRDRIMQDLSVKFPYYGWEKNAGYGTKSHLEAIRTHGLTSYHRTSFRIKDI